MGPIVLDVSNHSNLYEAWDSSQFEEIEGYNGKENAQSMYFSTAARQPKCIKETWISELPKCLIFTLNRVTYDQKVGIPIKNNKRFEFDKIIYADKYLLNNHQLDDKEKEIKIAEKKNKQSELKEKSSKLSNHHKGMGIEEILEVTRNFIKDRTEPGSDFENIYFPPDSKSPQVKSDSSSTHQSILSELK